LLEQRIPVDEDCIVHSFGMPALIRDWFAWREFKAGANAMVSVGQSAPAAAAPVRISAYNDPATMGDR